MVFVKIVLILWALNTNVLLGISVAILVMITHFKMKDMSDFKKLKEQVSDDIEENKLQERLKIVKGNGYNFPQRIEIYKECVIEDHENYFEIMGPSGQPVDRLYPSMEDAKAEIDIMEPMLPKIVMRRQRIHNIRFVR